MAWEYAVAGLSNALAPHLAAAPQRNRDRYYTQGLASLMKQPGSPVPSKPEASIFDPSTWGLSTAPDMPDGGAVNPDGSVDFDKLSRFAMQSGRTNDAVTFMKLGIAEEKRNAERKNRARKEAYRRDMRETFAGSKGLPDFGRAAEVAARHGMAAEAANFAKFGMAQADWREGKRIKSTGEFALRLGAAFNPDDIEGSLPHINRLVQQSPDLAAQIFGIPKKDMADRKIVGIRAKTSPDGGTLWVPTVQNSRTGTVGPLTNMGGTGKGEIVTAINPSRFLRYVKPYMPKPKKGKGGDDKWKLNKDGTMLFNEKDGSTKPVPTTKAGRRQTALDTLDELLEGMDKNLAAPDKAARVKSTVTSVLDSLEKKGVPATAIVNEATNVLLRPNPISKNLIDEPTEETRVQAMNAFEQYLLEHYRGQKGLGGAEGDPQKDEPVAKPTARRKRPAPPGGPTTPEDRKKSARAGGMGRIVPGLTPEQAAEAKARGQREAESLIDRIRKRARREAGLMESASP